ncbi:hypothetical protein [Micromonospora sp. CPCC 205556]|uniref:hypothetical protein n=1 Tax=Micromonospora sp. CPCC 205556 TaxID=3122398 RepID=UPI002FEFB4F3
MRRTWVIGAVVGGVVVALLCCGALAVGGVVLWWRPDNAHALAYADRLTVGEGYQRLPGSDWSDGTCGCNLLRSYVGPAGADPAAVFSGPGLTFGPIYRAPDRFWDHLAEGEGRATDTGACRLVVKRLRHGGSLGRVTQLSAEQAQDWYAGAVDVLEIYVDCERDHGGAW